MKTKGIYKLISLILAITLIFSVLGTTAFALETEEETKIYFEVPTFEDWGTTKSVYCHMYNVYGGSPLIETAWQNKAEKCSFDEEKGLYYFDTAKLGTIEEGADYALLFSTVDTNRAAHQTCNITFGKACLGDTVYLTGDLIQTTEDAVKGDYVAAWRNNSDKYGTKASITSTGKIVGEYFPVYKPKEAIVAENIRSWAVLNSILYTKEVVQDICTQVGIDGKAVYNYYANEYANELANPESYPYVASLDTVADLLGIILTGDVNGDGIVSISDATDIGKYLADLISFDENQLTKADFNGDEIINIADATDIQKKLANIDYNYNH